MVKRRGPRTEPRGTPDADRQKITYISARIHVSNGIPTVTPMFPGSDNIGIDYWEYCSISTYAVN